MGYSIMGAMMLTCKQERTATACRQGEGIFKRVCRCYPGFPRESATLSALQSDGLERQDLPGLLSSYYILSAGIQNNAVMWILDKGFVCWPAW